MYIKYVVCDPVSGGLEKMVSYNTIDQTSVLGLIGPFTLYSSATLSMSSHFSFTMLFIKQSYKV